MNIQKILMVNTPPHSVSNIISSKRSKFITEKASGIGLPYGLMSIGAYLESKNYNVEYVDYWSNSWEYICEDLKKYDADIIFSSCLTDSRQSSFTICKIAKEINPKIVTVVGNVHASAMYEQILFNYPQVDFVVIGEGEITCLELIEQLKYREKFLCSVRGIAYKSNGEICVTEKRPLIKDLDILPFPTKNRTILGNGSATINTSRGCPYGCVYCSLTHYWNIWRGRSAKEVIKEVDFLVSLGINHLNFTDDHFTFNKKRAMEIASYLEKINIKWRMQCRVDRIDAEMLKLFKKSGCEIIVYGTETLSPIILENVHKKFTLSQIEEAVKLTKEAGIQAHTNIMIGLPGENQTTINETINGIKRIKPDYVGKFITMVYPATDLYQMAKEKSMIDDNYWLSYNTAPFYTAEHDLATLRKYSLQIQLEWYKQQGIIKSSQDIYGLIKNHGLSFAFDYIKDGLSKVKLTKFMERF